MKPELPILKPGINRLKTYLVLLAFLTVPITGPYRIMMAADGWEPGAQAAIADPDAAAVPAERDSARRLTAVQRLLRPVRKANVELLIEVADRDADAAIRKEVVDRLGRVDAPGVADLLERRAASDDDAGVALLALERLRMMQARCLGEAFEKRLERARSADDTRSLRLLVPESQRWASYLQGALLPAFLQLPPPVFEGIPASNPVRVLAIGDYGTGSPAMKKTAAAAAAYHRDHPFDLGLTLGDNFPSNGLTGTADPRWKSQWEDLYAPLGIPFFASTGNHDWGFADSPAAEILYSQQSRTWRMPSLYYSFIAGPVQFFALATQAMSDAQLNWLDEELGRSKARWNVVYGHHPIYSHGSHGDTKGFATRLLPVLRNRAQIYIAGHEHTPQHLKPEGGVHLFVNAAAGQEVREAKPGPRTIYTGAFYGFTVIEAGSNDLKIRFVDMEGRTNYETTLQ